MPRRLPLLALQFARHRGESGRGWRSAGWGLRRPPGRQCPRDTETRPADPGAVANREPLVATVLLVGEGQLVARGAFDSAASRSKLLYLDLSTATDAERFLPFNVLAEPYKDHTMAEHIA